jgi:MinD superfamily P-loop ATPase
MFAGLYGCFPSLLTCSFFTRPKTAISDVAGAIEERRIKAKKLLIDVETQMGKDKLAEIVDVIKRFNQRSITTNLKAVIVDICNGYPEFEQRLLEFLPKRFS